MSQPNQITESTHSISTQPTPGSTLIVFFISCLTQGICEILQIVLINRTIWDWATKFLWKFFQQLYQLPKRYTVCFNIDTLVCFIISKNIIRIFQFLFDSVICGQFLNYLVGLMKIYIKYQDKLMIFYLQIRIEIFTKQILVQRTFLKCIDDFSKRITVIKIY